MNPTAKITEWLDTHFPKPRVDPEWLEGCTQWVEGDQHISPVTAFPQFMERVRDQLLESDLGDSMMRGTGLDPNTPNMTTQLRGSPVLMQITAITEIGSSAFQLDQVRVAREERLAAGVGDVEGDEEGDVEVEGEGPMPKYPRGTLYFHLSDGETTIEAMEYRAIPQLSLGVTPLGYKARLLSLSLYLQLKGTRIHKGMAMLEPATVTLLGGKQVDLEDNQAADLKNGLRLRLRRPMSPVPGVRVIENVAAELAPAAARSPLRDISPPPTPALAEHADDIEMEPRRRVPASSSLNSATLSSHPGNNQNRPIVGLPSRVGTSNDFNGNEGDQKRLIPRAERATLIGAASLSTTSSYFNGNTKPSGSNSSANVTVQNLDFNFVPTLGQLRRTLPSPPPPVDQSFDFNLFDDIDQENQPPSMVVDKGKGRVEDVETNTFPHAAENASSDEYDLGDDDFANATYIEDIDKVEKAALQRGASVGVANNLPSSGSTTVWGTNNTSSQSTAHIVSSSTAIKPTTKGRPAPPVVADVIEIDDSDDEMLGAEDKENAPVPTRHIRRKIDTTTQNRTQRNRPVVRKTDPEEIIDLSD
ncbi:hypothetical protein CPC08DRAFT_636483 [Agrocybe pediades]|nr:hypothetical protein CPC08DRAFT_636483 [Agrocybe pediades]